MSISRSKRRGSQPVLLQAGIELVIAVCVFVVYRAGRLVTSDSVPSATANAERVLDAQRWLIGTFELNVQRWVLDVPGAIDVLNHYYVFVHFPATTIFLVWAFARHRDRYRTIRNWFVGVTMAAMVVHVVFPLAPPRMLDGYVDTLREYGPNIYPEDPGRSLANQFAAMPSLHFGWALMVAIGIIAITTSRYRWWWLAHPTVTLLAIVATANHYLLDAAVAAALATVVGLVVLFLQGVRSAPRELIEPFVPREPLVLREFAGTPPAAAEHRSAPTQRCVRQGAVDPTRTIAARSTSSVRASQRAQRRVHDPVSGNSSTQI